MWWIEMLSVALGAMARNKVRAFLTMLGIIIGVCSVVVMMATGEGAKRAIEEDIAAMIDSDLTINPGPDPNRGWGGDEVLTYDNYVAVRDGCPLIRSIVPSYGGWSPQPILYREKTTPAAVIATSPGYFAMYRLVLAKGRGLVEADRAFSRRVCVLGANVATSLSVGPRIIGEPIQLSGWGSTFEVVGILAPRGRTGSRSVDDCVIAPIEASGDRFRGKISVAAMYVRLTDNSRMTEAASDIARVLRRSRKLGRGEPNNFHIVPTFEVSGLQREVQRILGALLAGIGSISLIVGGIGVMNIMLASVSERTREVGIRKALGATRSAILAQFVIEAIVLCATGGGAGIVLGWGISRLVSAKVGWALVVTPETVAVALAVSTSVGLIFGIAPAARAARLDPVDALRVE